MFYQHYKQCSSFIVSIPCTKHWIRFNRGQIHQGGNYLKGIIGLLTKNQLAKDSFFLCNIRIGLGLTAHKETEAKLHVFTTAHPVYLHPQSKWGPDRNQQRRFTPHESVIHQHRQPCCFRNCILHLCGKKERVVIKYQNWEREKTWWHGCRTIHKSILW